MERRYAQVDVFSEVPFGGNPVAVVLDGDGLSTDEMQRIARWTNLSETTFVLEPATEGASYRVRIFTPVAELPFAGHPTLGTCHAWLEAGGQAGDVVVQECGAGLVRVRRSDGRLAFAAPPLVRSGPVEEADLAPVLAALGLERVLDAAWIDNGPGWMGLLLQDAAAVLAVQPRFVDADVGLVGFHPPGGEAAIEVRGFFPKDGALIEDPVTGSLNASLAQWLTSSGRIELPYVAAQGTAIGRAGRIHVSSADGDVWVGGATVTRAAGSLRT
jgi:PhzF family phenazine biosynthesis protein